ncbi:Ubiquinone biosynthesis accessory factor UbiK [Candidatus Magnetaquicoccaceae bacterium FCR-1]|uniref:Ubiquinone biosynthesis accessory factor UbiK n=1 Tax=Candidatus Magnetaquiglobus chichijimensis TaxID=3141448 RepID=A0ABQ0C663_9PROT
MQIDNAILDQITQNMMGVFNKVGETREELRRKAHDMVREGVEHFDLVTREEFNVVNEMLSETRIRAEALEKRVVELEAALVRLGGEPT